MRHRPKLFSNDIERDGFKPPQIETKEGVIIEVYLRDSVETFKQQIFSTNYGYTILQPFKSNVRSHPMNPDLRTTAELARDLIKERKYENVYWRTNENTERNNLLHFNN